MNLTCNKTTHSNMFIGNYYFVKEFFFSLVLTLIMILIFYDYIVMFKGIDYAQPPQVVDFMPTDKSSCINTQYDYASAIINSTLINDSIQKSVIDRSYVTNTNIFKTILESVYIDNSTINNSTIFYTQLFNSIIMNFTIINSSINSSIFYNSIINNSIV